MGRNSAYKFFTGKIVLILCFFVCLSAYGAELDAGMTDGMRKAYAEAYTHYKKGEYKKTVITMDYYMKNSGGDKHGMADMILGNAHLKMGDSNLAFKHYRDSARFYKNKSDLWYNAASAAYSSGMFEEAEKSISQAVRYGGGDDIYRLAAYVALKLDRKKDIAGYLSKISKRNKQDNKMLLFSYATDGEFGKAKKLLSSLDTRDNPEWWKLYGLYVKNARETAAAFKIYLKLTGGVAEDKKHLAGVLSRLKIYDEAYMIYKSMSQEEKECGDLMREGVAAYKLERYTDAEAVLRVALGRKCGVDPGRQLAYVYFMNKDYRQAGEFFERYEDREGKYTYMAGISYLKNREYERAERVFQKLRNNKDYGNRAEKIIKYIEAKNERK